MADHHHDHSDGCGHGDDQSGLDGTERGLEYSLYRKVDLDRVECLNESREGDGRTALRAWEDRLRPQTFVESDVDEELLFNIPFTGLVKLKGLIVMGSDDDSHPATMRLYKNRPNMTFDDVGVEPDQTFEMTVDTNGTIEYATKVVKFSSIHHLSIHFSRNFGHEKTRVSYIGLRGEFTEDQRHGVTICAYESAPNPADHVRTMVDTVCPQIQ